jgi:hypothetical protein
MLTAWRYFLLDLLATSAVSLPGGDSPSSQIVTSNGQSAGVLSCSQHAPAAVDRSEEWTEQARRERLSALETENKAMTERVASNAQLMAQKDGLSPRQPLHNVVQALRSHHTLSPRAKVYQPGFREPEMTTITEEAPKDKLVDGQGYTELSTAVQAIHSAFRHHSPPEPDNNPSRLIYEALDRRFRESYGREPQTSLDLSFPKSRMPASAYEAKKGTRDAIPPFGMEMKQLRREENKVVDRHFAERLEYA